MSGIGLTLVRLVRYAPVPFQRLCDRWWWPWWLRLSGVQYGQHLRCTGRPFVRIGPGGAIILGDRVFLNRGLDPRERLSCVITVRSGARVVVGDDCGLTAVLIYSASMVSIGCRVLVGNSSVIMDTDFHPLEPEARREHRTQGALSRPIHIGNDVFIGRHAFILKGTELGDGCVVGAGAVVAGKFPPRSVIVGNPARVVKTLPPPAPLSGETLAEASESNSP